ncbi:hypothetical protein [Lutibacter sp.]|uniref:hypothetical protein n=1 Tax=Lutibacter sp. TaxID=1925666 RepID=UPI0025BC44ED|nr:hypothetical protein [Lutibacter sp.]MCF6169282.1 hypothetical protein [Lutibacter sp.]
MATINKISFQKIIDAKKRGEISFHLQMENDMFEEILSNYQENRFLSSASTAFVLYERIFITRLSREINSPNDFTPNKENIFEQLDYLINKEREVVDGKKEGEKRGLSFKNITKELKERKIISEKEKENYDSIYDEYRNPVLHGLTYRLYESIFNKKPNNSLEIDLNYKIIYKRLSEKIINEIYTLISSKKLIKE